jgi:hypothetical protein
MKNEGWSGSSNIQAQFFHRVFGLSNNNIHIGVFCKPNYLTGPSFSGFRKKFFTKFSFTKGFLFKASHFTDVSSVWGIHFALFQNRKGNFNYEFIHDLLDLNDKTEFLTLGEKILYNTDNKISLSKYNESITPEGVNITFPKFSSALKIKDSNWGSELKKNTFATMVSNANNVAKNANSVYIVNGGIGENVGKVHLNTENLLTALLTFSVRKSISGDWMNDKDEYLMPNLNHLNFNQFKFDSLVYSLFNNSSEQSSLRQILYKTQLWNVKNQFFWMSKEEMVNLANNNNYTELYNDARTDSDRYVYNLLFGEQRIYDQLSDEAKDVLDSGTNLVRLSFAMRRNFANDTNHLNSWDAGYAQLKLLWKEYYPEQFKEFRAKYKVLEDKMRPMVYELGFLLK